MAPLTLTLADLIAEVRSLLAEPSSGFYLDSEITRWLNLGILDFATKTKVLSSSATSPSVIGQKKYSLPSDFLIPEKVFYDNQELDVVDHHELLYRATRANLDQQGTVESYYLQGTADSGNCLFLYRVPSSVKTIEVWYIAAPEALVNQGDTILLAREWSNAACLFAAHRGHMKQRQLGDASACYALYNELVSEAIERKAEFQVDRPLEAHDIGMWADKRARWRW